MFLWGFLAGTIVGGLATFIIFCLLFIGKVWNP